MDTKHQHSVWCITLSYISLTLLSAHMVQTFITASVGFPVGPQFYPCWTMQILMPAIDSVSCSVSVSVDWSALELAGLFLWLPVNWTAGRFVCLSALHSVDWSAWHSLSWIAFVPEGCSVSCCAWWPASRRQLGPWAGPTEVACDWSSGAGSEPAGWVRRNWAAGVSLGGRENGNNHYNQTVGKHIVAYIEATQETLGHIQRNG